MNRVSRKRYFGIQRVKQMKDGSEERPLLKKDILYREVFRTYVDCSVDVRFCWIEETVGYIDGSYL